MGDDGYPSTMSDTNYGSAESDPDVGKYRKPNRKERRRLDSLIDRWHKSKTNRQTLHEYLGMTTEQYARFVTKGEIPNV